MISRQDVVNDETPLGALEVPTHLGKALVKELTAHDWSLYQKQIRTKGAIEIIDSNAVLVAWTLHGKEGRLFDPSSPEDVKILSKKGTSFISPLFLAANEVNLANKTLEQLKKNSQKTLSADSGTN